MALRTLDVAALAACLALVVGIYLKKKQSILPYPPGPAPTPVFGNIKDIPKSYEWEVYAKMSQTYGPVVHLKILYKHLIVINSAQAAAELLDKRSTIYSDRPRFVMMNELMGWDWNMANMVYGDSWLVQRRVLQHYFHQKSQHRWIALQQKNSLIYMRALLDTPDKFWAHTRRASGANIMTLAYGIEIGLEGDDPYVVLADNALGCIARAALPGSYLCDWVPWVKNVPSWFPGAKFKRDAEEWRKYPQAMLTVPFAKVKENLAAGKARPCIATELLEDTHDQALEEEVMKAICAISYVGGADTTVSVILSFIHQMVLYPEIQRKAQEEVDKVVGHERLPEYTDRPSLPYVEALVRETLRCFPVVPLGVPRALRVSDEYNGMYLPGGSTVLVNIWAILHDPEVYPDPLKYNPERWLHNGAIDERVPDPRLAQFGYGRRICPGRFFADTAIFIALANLLSCFSLEKAVDENGVEITPSSERRSGAISFPNPFPCVFKPRSANVRKLVQAGIEAHE